MLRTLVSLSALFFSTLLLLLANGLLGSLLGLKLTYLDASPLSIALLMTGFYAGYLAGTLSALHIVKKVGHIRSFAAFCAINVSSTLAITLVDSTTAWVVFRFLIGVSMMGSYMVIESWLNERIDNSSRGRIFSVYMATSFLGIGGGQFMLGFEDGTNTLINVAALLFALCALPIVLTGATVPQPVSSSSFRVGKLIKLAPHAVFGCLVAGLASGSFYGLGMVYGVAQNDDPSFVAQFMGFTIMGGLLLQWPIGSLSDRIKRRLLLNTLGIGLAAMSLLILLTPSASWQLLLALIWGGFAFTIYPVSVAYANDRVEADELVAATGVLLMAFGSGAALGPLLAGIVMQLVGNSGLYLFTAACGLSLTLFVSQRRGAKRVSIAQQDNFVATPPPSVVVMQLDPRAELDEALPEVDPSDNTGAATMMANPPDDEATN